jgi:hypothetical protein
MVRSEISNPSIRSSPANARPIPYWILGHHSEDELAHFLWSCLRPIGLRTLEINFQDHRKPARCHTTTVPGVTKTSACFHPNQDLRATTQKTISNTSSRGLGRLRFKAASCRRRVRFSSRRLRRARKARKSARHRFEGVCHAGLISQFASGRQRCSLLRSHVDRISANHNPNPEPLPSHSG